MSNKAGMLGILDGYKTHQYNQKIQKSFRLSYDQDELKLFSKAKITSSDKIYETDRAIWDTGASITAISHAGARKLAAAPSERGTTISATDLCTSDIYLATVELPGGIVFKDIELWDVDLSDAQYDVVIGMDIISRGDLHVISSTGSHAFYFETDQDDSR